MDVAAQNHVDAMPARVRHHGLFEGADEADSAFDLVLAPLREGPVRQSEVAPHAGDMAVEPDGEVVSPVAQQREPAHVAYHRVELVAVQDEHRAAIGAAVNGFLLHFYAAEIGANIVAEELVVIARNVDDAGALADLAQQLLHHVVVALRPVPALAQAPAVDDVADQIDRIGLVDLEEIEEDRRLAATCSQMNIREEEGSDMSGFGHRFGLAHSIVRRFMHG